MPPAPPMTEPVARLRFVSVLSMVGRLLRLRLRATAGDERRKPERTPLVGLPRLRLRRPLRVGLRFS